MRQLIDLIRYQISPRDDGQYSVIDVRTLQTLYTGSLEGARQAQAQLLRYAR